MAGLPTASMRQWIKVGKLIAYESMYFGSKYVSVTSMPNNFL